MDEDALKNWLGPMPSTADCDPAVDVLATREYREFTEKKIIYSGHGGDVVPAYLLIPRGSAAPVPGVVAFHQCGLHCDIGKEQVVGKRVDLPDQAYGYELALRGYAVLAPDARNVGERFDPGLRKQWQCAADRPGQDRCCCGPGGSWGMPRWQPVFDAIRSVDVISSQVEVDAGRIGAIGHSLGADTIVWSLPFEKRLRAVAISGGGIMKAAHEGWQPYALPFEQLLGLFVNAGVAWFEFAGVRDPIHRLDDPRLDDPDTHMQNKRALYAGLAKSLRPGDDRLVLMTADCGHCFHESGRQCAYEFLDRHLRGGDNRSR